MSRWKPLAALMLCLSAGLASAELRSGWVSWVLDGDTVQVLLEGQSEPIKLRLKDMDAPELCQPGGEAAREALVALALRQRVEVELLAEDVYGRQVGRVVRGGLDLGAEMVHTGMAWAYRFRTGQGPYARLQRQAQKNQWGLFAAPETAMSPPLFRQFHGSCHSG